MMTAAKSKLKSKKQLENLKPKIQKWLKGNVTQRRYKHIIGVAKTAKKYAKQLKLDFYKAELSGWLHDCAKEMTNRQLLNLARKKKVKIEKVDLKNPHVLHARVGAVLAKDVFKIRDKDVLAGIRCHTLAEPNMSKIAMVVYLADATEPGRDKDRITPLKKTFKNKGLEHAVLHAIDMKLIGVINKQRLLHPYTLQARNWLVDHIN